MVTSSSPEPVSSTKVSRMRSTLPFTLNARSPLACARRTSTAAPPALSLVSAGRASRALPFLEVRERWRRVGAAREAGPRFELSDQPQQARHALAKERVARLAGVDHTDDQVSAEDEPRQPELDLRAPALVGEVGVEEGDVEAFVCWRVRERVGDDEPDALSEAEALERARKLRVAALGYRPAVVDRDDAGPGRREQKGGAAG